MEFHILSFGPFCTKFCIPCCILGQVVKMYTIYGYIMAAATWYTNHYHLYQHMCYWSVVFLYNVVSLILPNFHLLVVAPILCRWHICADRAMGWFQEGTCPLFKLWNSFTERMNNVTLTHLINCTYWESHSKQDQF